MTQRPSTPILLATGNRDKQEQFLEILAGLPLSPVTPGEIGLSVVPDEDGDTHESIARQKAMEWSDASSTLVIASDGGLLIPALGPRWESRYTRRFAGPAADNDQRLARLLELMRPYSGEERRASWVEALSLAYRGRVLVSWELSGGTGYLDDRLPDGPPPGFWVFSVWRFPQYGATYNRLTGEQRDSIDDHWGRLRRMVRRYFQSIFVPPG